MANKQIFAQIGVFALLGLNVGAYYVFWPHRESGAQQDTKPAPQAKGQTQLLPEPKAPPLPIAVAPKEKPAEIVPASFPLQIPSSAPPAAEVKNPDETIGKLLDHINKDATPMPMPAVETRNIDERPARVVVAEEKKPAPIVPVDTENVAVASAMTPKLAPSPWLLNMEMVGTQTQLIARMRQPIVNTTPAIEFKILCDRVEVKSPGAVQAIGKVAFAGANIKGTCQRLTLPLHETHLIFEDKANIVGVGNLSSSLRGERIVWELAANTAETQPLVAPADFRPFSSFPLNPASLDRPK